MIRRVDFLLNPRAGKGQASARAAEASRILTSAGISCVVHVPGSQVAARDLAQHLARPESCVVACGGDGTVHWVAQGMVQGPATFDILPTGTGNDIHSAVHPGATGSVDELVNRILGGQSHVIDVGEVAAPDTTRYFLGVCTTGFDSVVNLRANAMSRGPSSLRYIAAVLRELPALTPRTWRIEQRGRQWEETGVILAIANGGIYGGGMRISPRARTSDGLLDVTLVRPVGRARLVALFPLVYSGAHLRRPEVSTWCCTSIGLGGEPGPVMCDGEYLGLLPVSIRVVTNALRIAGSGVA